MSEKFIPLSIPNIGAMEKSKVSECLDSGWVSSSGPWVNEFESAFAQRLKMPSAVSTASGTAALHLALIVAGVRRDEEVLAPTLTFAATINAIRYVSASPVFFGCDDYLNFDVAALARFIETNCYAEGRSLFNSRSKKQIKAIIVAHIFGHPAEMKKVIALLEPYDVKIIEDAAESLGSTFLSRNGAIETGTLGEIGCFSFNGNKIISTGGGGMVLAKEPAILSRIRHLSTQAKVDEIFFLHDEVGYNYRLNSLQAALGISQLARLDKFIEIKRNIYRNYKSLFDGKNLGQLIAEPNGTHSNYWLNSLVIPEAMAAKMREVVAGMGTRNIQVRPVWHLNHLQAPFSQFEKFETASAEKIKPRILNLPSSTSLLAEDQERVVSCLEKVFAELGYQC